MKKKTFFRTIGLFFLIGFGLSIFAQKEVKIIESVDIQGNRRICDEEILKLIVIRPGDKFDETQVQKDLQSLLALGVFDAANTNVFTENGVRGGVNVIFEVRELPIIAEIKFEGLKYIRTEEVLAELSRQNVIIKVQEPFKAEKFAKAQKIIKEYLQKQGFLQAKVFTMTEYFSATELNVGFIIDEMPDDDEADCCEKTDTIL
jgi:outer membrane protein insertion porin family